MTIAETRAYHLGPYLIQQRPMPDNPYFAHFMIFRGGKLIGKQLSVPTIGDCKWLELQRGVYATCTADTRVPWKTPRAGRKSREESEAELLEALDT